MRLAAGVEDEQKNTRKNKHQRTQERTNIKEIMNSMKKNRKKNKETKQAMTLRLSWHMPRSGPWDGVGHSCAYMIAFKNIWSSWIYKLESKALGGNHRFRLIFVFVRNVILVCKRRESTSGSDGSVSTWFWRMALISRRLLLPLVRLAACALQNRRESGVSRLIAGIKLFRPARATRTALLL